MYITAQGPRVRNDLYCVEWGAKLVLHTIPFQDSPYNWYQSATIRKFIGARMMEVVVTTGAIRRSKL